MKVQATNKVPFDGVGSVIVTSILFFSSNLEAIFANFVAVLLYLKRCHLRIPHRIKEFIVTIMKNIDKTKAVPIPTIGS